MYLFIFSQPSRNNVSIASWVLELFRLYRVGSNKYR